MSAVQPAIDTLDAEAIRAGVPSLAQTNEHGQRLVLLDSAARLQKPRGAAAVPAGSGDSCARRLSA